MDPSLATIIVASIAAVTTSVVAPIVTYWLKYVQDRKIAEKLATKVDGVVKEAVTTASKTDAKIDGIHELVNARMLALTTAWLR